MDHRARLAVALAGVAALGLVTTLAVIDRSGPPAATPPPASIPALPAATTAGPPVSPFTGLPVPAAPAPVLAVKIDNIRQARPQSGLDAADLVYVEPVEGGLSRLIAVFSSQLPDVVGPVRSVRETDLELLAQFGAPALAYSGSAPELHAALAATPLAALSPAQAPQAFYREPSRRAPHNSYARPAGLLAAAPNASPAADIGFRFGDLPPSAQGAPVQHRAAGYPAAGFAFDWSPATGRWLVGLDGAPLLTAAGAQVTAATVILQSVAVRTSALSDALGHPSPVAQTVGSGPAVVLRDSAAFATTWSRPTPTSGTTFTAAGHPFPFARGPVWVALLPTA